MASNTEILIKRSLVNNKPTTLNQGELAFSYTSNTLFIGTPGSDDAFEIGGYRDYSANFTDGPGQYGSSTEVPVITVSANGQITAIDTASISTSLGIVADNGSSTVDLLTQSLDIAGGAGITSTVSGQTITLDVDDTVLRTNTAITLQNIDGSVQISGNLTVTGNVTSIDVQTLNVSDPLIYLAGNNYTSDIVDIGYVGNYFDGSTQRHAGVYRHAGDKQFYVFDNYDQEPDNNLIDPTDPSFRLATLNTNLTSGYANVSVLLDVTGSAQVTGTLKAGLSKASQSNIVYFNASTGELTYEDSAVLTPHQISNGSYSMTISGDDGKVNAPAKIVVSESSGTNGGGYSFWQDGGEDTGMFSDGDGELSFYGNAQELVRISATNNTIRNYAALYLKYGASVRDFNNNALAIGINAGLDESQGYDAIAIGTNAGASSQNISAVAVGNGAGNLNQSFSAVAVGRWAGEQNQGWDATAVGRIAGRYNQGDYSTAMGWHAGRDHQGSHSVAIGDASADYYQGAYAVSIGSYAGNNSQGWGAIALGANAGYSSQGLVAVAIGSNSGRYNQSQGATAVGRRAGESNQGTYATAIGRYAGRSNQSQNAVAIGHVAGESSQGEYATALGWAAGNDTQGGGAVALGVNAGNSSQGGGAIAIGNSAGYSNQQSEAIAIGISAGGNNQEQGAIGIGSNAGQAGHQYSVALGYQAGYNDSTPLGDYAIAIGYRAGYDSGVNNSIVLNASGSNLSAASAGLYINPVRYTETQDATDDGIMYYNQTTKEVRYSYALDGGSF